MSTCIDRGVKCVIKEDEMETSTIRRRIEQRKKTEAR